VKQVTLWLLLAAAVVLLAYFLYQSRRAGSALEVEPHAAEEIEKAQRR